MSSFASSAWNRQFLAGLLAVPQHKILWIPYGYAFHEVQMSHSHSKGSKIVVKRWYRLVLLLIKQVNTFGDNKTDTLSFTLWFGIKEHYPRLYVKSINLRDSNRRSPETPIDSCKSMYHTAQRFFLIIILLCVSLSVFIYRVCCPGPYVFLQKSLILALYWLQKKLK